MCFSAGASFGAGILLGSIGAVAVRRASSASILPFAMIPILFSAQQFAEGFVWLSANGVIDHAWERPAVLLFLLFAQVIWPVWVPMAVLIPETSPQRKRILRVLLISGAALGAYHTYCLLTSSFSADVIGQHVNYQLNFPSSGQTSGILIYLIVTIVPPYLSTIKGMNMLGVAILISFLGTLFFYEEYVISVWCFFAAILSIIVVWIVSEVRTPNLVDSAATQTD